MHIGSLQSDWCLTVCVRSYAHFCRCGKRIHKSLIKAGGCSFLNCQKVDRENWKTLDKWIQEVIEGLSCLELRTAEELGGKRWTIMKSRTQEVVGWWKPVHEAVLIF